MTETTSRASIRSAAVIGILGVVIFFVGALLGYCDGAFGDDGSVEQGLDWAIKTGFLLVAMSAVLGLFGGLILARLRLPAFIGWAFVMALAFAIMNGGGILLNMSDKAFWPETVKGLLLGAIVGAISGPLIHRNQLRIQKAQHDVQSSSQQ